MAKVELSSDIIKHFHGDVGAWLKKVWLVARLQKIDVARLLSLKEGTLQLYLEMDEDQLTNIDLIEAWLKEVFSDRV